MKPSYQWGVWRFEPTECKLMREGELVPLPAKTLDLLATLLRRAPRLVTKEDILKAVWPDASVEEGNIAFHVNALRKTLDEDDAPSAIETVRGRGYRFARDVVVHEMVPTADIKQVVADLRSAPETKALVDSIAVQAGPPRSKVTIAAIAAVIAASLIGVSAFA